MVDYDAIKFCVHYLVIGFSIMTIAKKICDAGLLANIMLVLAWPVAVAPLAICIAIIDDLTSDDEVRD